MKHICSVCHKEIDPNCEYMAWYANGEQVDWAHLYCFIESATKRIGDRLKRKLDQTTKTKGTYL